MGDYVQGLIPTGPVHRLGEVGKCEDVEKAPEVGPVRAVRMPSLVLPAHLFKGSVLFMDQTAITYSTYLSLL